MNTVSWTRRSSNAGPFRTSVPHIGNNDGGIRQSRSVERHSRIPLRSSSSQAIHRVGSSALHMNKERSKSHAPSVASDTSVNTGKMTPSQFNFGSRTASGCSSSRTAKKLGFAKDNRNLHDKEYIRESALIVQQFFQEKSPDIIHNGTDIRPMTIKMFIGMVNYLFEALEIVDKRQNPIVFEVSTYEKELPYWMKKLNYPGLINKAWLQTVNVPNNWHHVIGLLSWLVRICQISALYDFEEQLETDDPSRTWEMYYFKQSLKSYRVYNSGKMDEYEELCKEVVQRFYEINKVDEQENEILQQEIEELQRKLENPNALAEKDELDEAYQKLNNAELLSEKLFDEIGKKEYEIEQKKAKLLEKEKICESLRNLIPQKKDELENLKNAVLNQPVSMSEILELRRKSEYLDKEMKFLEKECEDLFQLISGYEFEAAGRRDKILQATHAFNRNIIQLEQIVPELKEFRIYRDPEDEEILPEMKNAVAALTDLKKLKIQMCEELEMQIKKKEEEIEVRIQSVKNMTEAIAKLEEANEVKKKKNAALQVEFEEKEKLLKEESEMWDGKLKVIEEKVKEFSEVKEKLQKLLVRHEELSRLLEKTEELAEEFWAKYNDRLKDVPEKLEQLMRLVEDQTVEIKTGCSQLMTALEPEDSMQQ